jgi:hypothetical protein
MLIDIGEFQRLLAQKGFQIVDAGKPILSRSKTISWLTGQSVLILCGWELAKFGRDFGEAIGQTS